MTHDIIAADAPQPGDVARMHGQDVRIEIVAVASEQSRAGQGEWAIVDQYGETHVVELDDGRWMAVVPAI